MRATLTWAAAALMMAASAVTACAQTPTEINFGVISTEASMNQKKNWEPFLQAMSKATGLKVNGFYATDYAGVIEAMRFNKVHLAWYGNKSGMEAVDRANGEVFAQIVARDGSVGYYSHVIVHKRQPLHQDRGHPEVRQVARLRYRRSRTRRRASWCRPPTSSRRDNIDPENLLQDGAQRATTRRTRWRSQTSRSPPRPTTARICSAWPRRRRTARSQIRIIWTSPLIPLDPLVWRKDLDPAVKTRLYTFLMSYGRIGTDERDQGCQGRPGRPHVVAVSSLVRQPVDPDPEARGEQGPDEGAGRREAVRGGEGHDRLRH